MKNKTETKVNFLLIIDDVGNPDKIKKYLKMKNVKTWRKGDLIDPNRTVILKEKNTGLLIKSGLSVFAHAEEHLNHLLKVMRPKWNLIKKLCKKYPSEFAFHIFTEKDDISGIHFDRKTLDLIHELGSDIDLDLY